MPAFAGASGAQQKPPSLGFQLSPLPHEDARDAIVAVQAETGLHIVPALQLEQELCPAHHGERHGRQDQEIARPPFHGPPIREALRETGREPLAVRIGSDRG
jgi:hypothetical protein